MARSAPPDTRYLGIDLHKDYLVIGGVNAEQQVVLQPRRFTFDAWIPWAKAHLRQSDVLVVEATSNTWTFHDAVLNLVARVEVANARKVAWIAASGVKTDRLDVMKLAQLSAAHLVPLVWVPPRHVRELRALFSHRRRLLKVSTLVKNRLQSLLHRHQLKAPPGDLFGLANRDWWIALGVLAAIGDISRFKSARKLVGYAGLGARVHYSGQTHHTGRITKSGRRDLRFALVEAARAAAEHHPFWAAVAAQLGARIGEKKALVAIARRLLVTIWQVLTKRQADLHAVPEHVATKFMRWAWSLSPEHRHGLQTRDFIRWKLLPLGIGADLTHLVYGHKPRRVASAEELFAARPDLRPPD